MYIFQDNPEQFSGWYLNRIWVVLNIHDSGMLMQAAYTIHRALAAILPFEIPREKKIAIKECIQMVEKAASFPILFVLDIGEEENERKNKKHE